MTLLAGLHAVGFAAAFAIQILACGTSNSPPLATTHVDAKAADASSQPFQLERTAVTFDVTDPVKDRVQMLTPARQVATKRSFAGLHVRGLDHQFNVTLFGNLRLKDLVAGVQKGTVSIVERREGAMIVSRILNGRTGYFGLAELYNRGSAYMWTCEAPWSSNLKETREGFEACLSATYLPDAAD